MIELLIVIAIIGVLAVAFIPTMLDAPSKARDAQRMSNLKRIGEFIYTEYVATGKPLPLFGDASTGSANDNEVAFCVHPDSYIGSDIKNNIQFFSGVFPEDPSGEGQCIEGIWCCGYYFYITAAFWPGSPYAAILMANPEKEENGNIEFAGYSDFISQGASLSDTGDYYLQGIQK